MGLIFKGEKFQAQSQSVGEIFWARNSCLVLFKPQHMWLIKSALSGTYQNFVFFFPQADIESKAQLSFLTLYKVNTTWMSSAHMFFIFFPKNSLLSWLPYFCHQPSQWGSISIPSSLLVYSAAPNTIQTSLPVSVLSSGMSLPRASQVQLVVTLPLWSPQRTYVYARFG